MRKSVKRAGGWGLEALERRCLLSVEPLLNLASRTAGSSPANFAAFNGQVVFTAAGALGYEPYITDGTRQGTRLLSDITPGTNGSSASMFFAVGQKLFFMAYSPGVGGELWVSDGSTAGTHLVADLTVGTGNSIFSRFTAFDNRLYFVLNNNLWRSDGTSAGTTQVASNIAGYKPVVFKNELYFVTNETGGSFLRALSSTGGNRLVTSAKAEPDFGIPTKLLVFGDYLYFSADSGTGYELHRTDGTAAGTALFFEGNSNGSGNPKLLDASGGKMYFTSRLTGTLSGTLFVTDGAAITQTPLVFGGSATSPNNYISWHGLLLFNNRDSAGDELWVADGTPTGAKRVADIVPGSSSSSPSQFEVVDDVVYFVAASAWYSTDGTSAGTQRFLKAYRPVSPRTLSGKVVASLNHDQYGTEPTAFNPLNDDSELLRDLNSKPIAPTLSSFVTAGSHTYFSLDGDVWRTDGTSSGTLSLGISDSLNSAKVGPDGRTYLLTGASLYVTDGTPANTSLLANLPGSALYQMFLGNQVIVLASSGSNPVLYGVDRTTGEKTLLSTLVSASNAVMNTTANGRVFVTAKIESARIFISDGTAAGTGNFEVFPSNYNGFFGGIGSTSQAAFITAIQYGTQMTLYRTDGTSAGSFNLLNGIANAMSGALVFEDQVVAFVGNTLYRTNAGQTALQSVGTFAGYVPSFGQADARAADTSDRIFFLAGADDSNVASLWITDTTGANPALVTSLNLPISGVGAPLRLLGTSHAAYFDDGTNLYVSDGTASGTIIVAGLGSTGYAAARAALDDWLLTYDAQGAYRLVRVGTGATGAIQGTLFFDDDAGGSQGASEDPMTARVVYLDLNNNELLDANEPRQTNSGIGFRFGGLAAGTYTVRAVLSPGEVQTSSLATIMLADGQVVSANVGVHSTDSLPPVVLKQTFSRDDASVELIFDGDVSVSAAANITLQNVDSGQQTSIDPSAIAVDIDWNRATIKLPMAALTDGNYSLIIHSGTLLDASLNGNAEVSQEFYVLAADATQDRSVDTRDFNVLAANFGRIGAAFSEGNLNDDLNGRVDSQDFDLLIAQYGKKLAQGSSPNMAPGNPMFSRLQLQQTDLSDFI